MCCLSVHVCVLYTCGYNVCISCECKMLFLENDVLENVMCYVCLCVVCVIAVLGAHVNETINAHVEYNH